MLPFAAATRGDSRRRRQTGTRLLLFRTGQQPSSTTFLQAIAFPADVDRCRVMEQSVEDGGRDDRIAENRAPVAVALIARQDDAASFVTSADELEEDGCTEVVQRQVAHLVDDQHLRREV